MRLTKQIVNTAKDLVAFGPGFVFATNLARIRKDQTARVNVRGVGPIHIRGGNSDVAMLRQIFRQNEYDLDHPAEIGERFQRRYREILAAGRKPIIVDAGANIGGSALYFEQKFPEARIVSVEPDAGNVAVLRRNLERRPNHVILEAAIGAMPGFVSVVGHEQGWAVQTERADKGLPIVTIEDAFKASGGDDPLLVKIDIEGFESDLFSTNLGWIERSFAIAVEPHDWMLPGKGTSLSFQKALAPHGFEVFIKGENLLYVRM